MTVAQQETCVPHLRKILLCKLREPLSLMAWKTSAPRHAAEESSVVMLFFQGIPSCSKRCSGTSRCTLPVPLYTSLPSFVCPSNIASATISAAWLEVTLPSQTSIDSAVICSLTCGAAASRSNTSSLACSNTDASACCRLLSLRIPLFLETSSNSSTTLSSFCATSASCDDAVTTRGRHAECRGRITFKAASTSCAIASAAARNPPSALVTTTKSASSMIPRLIPCNPSPAPGGSSKMNMSTMPATATSD
mmetsp:Transcript_44955/g.97769  ORF Transcript_44955/g.97769 Transcript_44955/m.97769 type:complete len:250 (-) Transcript_44955:2-751(-)